MREIKRVLLAPKLWGVLALLLAISIVLSVAQDTHSRGFYPVYQSALQELKEMQVSDAQAQVTEELEQIQDILMLQMWQQEENPELKQWIYDSCAEAFGADFELRVAQGEFDLSEDALQQNLLRQEALREIQPQLTHLAEYPAYLAQVQANVKQMQALSIFNGGDPFAMRNIEKTGKDFPQTVELQLGNDVALTSLLTDELGGYLLMLYTLFITLQFLAERKRGLWSMVHTASEGRGRLARKRAVSLLLGVALGTIVLLGGKLLYGMIVSGSLGDLNRNVQSLAIFSDFPWVMPIWVFLLGYFVLKILGMWLVGLTIWAIMQSINYVPLAIGTAVGVLAAEYALFRFIPDSFSIVFLRYVNLLALVDVPKVALNYLNLNIFGYPVQGFLLSLCLLVPALGLLFGLNVYLAERKKPVTRQNSIIALFDRCRRPVSRAAGRLRLLGMELYKLLWLQKGILVLLAFACFALFFLEVPWPDTELYDTELAAVSAQMQGEITEQTLEQIDSKIEEYSQWEPSEAISRQLDILARLRQKVTDSLEAEDGQWLIVQASPAALMGKNYNNYQRQNALIMLLTLVLLLSGVFAQEKQSDFRQLLHGTPRGNGILWRKKLVSVLLLTGTVWLVFELCELKLIQDTYGAFALEAPLQSFDVFADFSGKFTLGVGIAIFLLLRLLAMLIAAGVIMLLSALCKRSNFAMLLACAVLVLPACLSYMGIELFDSLSLSKLFSPLEASPGAYLCGLLAAGASVFASRYCWRNTKTG